MSWPRASTPAGDLALTPLSAPPATVCSVLLGWGSLSPASHARGVCKTAESSRAGDVRLHAFLLHTLLHCRQSAVDSIGRQLAVLSLL